MRAHAVRPYINIWGGTMKLSNLLECLDTIEVNVPVLDVDVAGISHDTRDLRPDGLFVAIKGAVEDGHSYIDKAFQKGACLVVCEEKLSSDIPHVWVPDTHIALARLAACFHGNPERLQPVRSIRQNPR